jgi:hypothetical protein
MPYMNTTTGNLGWIAPLSFVFVLAGCAARAPKGAEVVAPTWKGAIDSTARLGVYLAAPIGGYSQAGFETMSRAEEAMKLMRPRSRWTWIDSSHPGTDALRGWDLDSLSILVRQDKALEARPGTGLRKAVLEIAPPTRAAIRRVGSAYQQDLIVVLRTGGARAEKDSTKLFQDKAWFGIFDCVDGSLLYSLQAPSEGKQSVAASAESDWARSVWDEFRQALGNLPKRLK